MSSAALLWLGRAEVPSVSTALLRLGVAGGCIDADAILPFPSLSAIHGKSCIDASGLFLYLCHPGCHLCDLS